ncbi:MAG: hypothetical protein IKF61_03015 [Firmicutes bacterium]|nr:hypothetical protein [Bacillota bacterium]
MIGIIFCSIGIASLAGFGSVIAMLVEEERLYKLILKEKRKKYEKSRVHDPTDPTHKEEFTEDSKG